jgi:hypothetical protein
MLMKVQSLYTLPARVSHINSHCTTQTPQTPQALMRKTDILQVLTKPRRSEDPTRPNLGQEEFRGQTSP